MLRFIFLSTCLCLVTVVSAYDCDVSIRVKNDGKFPPLILHSNGDRFYYPDENLPHLQIYEGKAIILACLGQSNGFKNFPKLKEVKAKCYGNETFLINGDYFEFSNLACKQTPESTVQVTDAPCFKHYTYMNIGFQLSTNFVPTIQVCRDNRNYTTYYTKYRLSEWIRLAQGGVVRPSWTQGSFYGNLDVNALYGLQSQIDTFATILELPKEEIERKYIIAPGKPGVKQQSLTRGHMTPKGDFIYGSEQSSTFWLINSAPQWFSTNSGNWKAMEDSVKLLAGICSDVGLDVYTGAHEILKLPNSNGQLKPMYLKYDQHGILPVPKFFWKVIYDPQSKRGTALLGLNNPFITEITSDVYLCRDVASKLSWLNYNVQNPALGVLYACTVDSARNRIPSIPQLDVVGLL